MTQFGCVDDWQFGCVDDWQFGIWPVVVLLLVSLQRMSPRSDLPADQYDGNDVRPSLEKWLEFSRRLPDGHRLLPSCQDVLLRLTEADREPEHLHKRVFQELARRAIERLRGENSLL